MPTDPTQASRLLDMIGLLEDGHRFDDALERAGVTRAQAVEFFDSMRKTLAGPAKKKAATKKKAASKKAVPRRTPSASGDATVIVAYSDGGSRGNPGRAACGAILCDVDGGELMRRYRLLGKATNNVAEYEGAVLALRFSAELGAREVRLRLDSELVVKQIQGSYKVKHPDLKPYHQRVLAMSRGFDRFTVEHVRRQDNTEADALVNEALDGKAEDGENAG